MNRGWGEGGALRILIVSDAWHPQVNGVVRTMETVLRHLRDGGDVVEVIGPAAFRSVPAPGYSEIRLAVLPGRRQRKVVNAFAPDAVHIATEGPLGWAMRRLCRARGWRFTTSFHTRFPDYLHARTGVPRAWSWAVMRRFHAPSAGVLAATGSLVRELVERGFGPVRRWSRGVDLARFNPAAAAAHDDLFAGPFAGPFAGMERPVFLYAGRVAVEKNIAGFLSLDLPGTKVVGGDGPQLPALRRRFPDAVFTGYRENGELAAHYAAADVFVFPSRTDTFGLVLLEALASGTPVAALPVSGPLDVVGDAPVGALVTVNFTHLDKPVKAQFQVIGKDEVVLTGAYSQQGLEGCQAPDPVGELEFSPGNRFAVTFRPFESYRDYWGSYSFDPATRRLAMKVEGGNFVPEGLDLEGEAELVAGRLVLRGVFLGSRGGAPQQGCTYRF